MTVRSKSQIARMILLALASLVLAGPALAAVPVVQATASAYSGPWPLTVQFTAAASDPDGGTIVRYHWYFADGYTSEEQNPVHTYNCYGIFGVQVTAYDSQGEMGTANLTIAANQVLYSSSVVLTPVVKYASGKLKGGTIEATVTVRDTEGYSIFGALVRVTWTTPAGTISQIATTDGFGVAVFSVPVPKSTSGIYALQVTDIRKPNCFFDNTLGVSSASARL